MIQPSNFVKCAASLFLMAAWTASARADTYRLLATNLTTGRTDFVDVDSSTLAAYTAYVTNRANQSGTQPASSISDLVTALAPSFLQSVPAQSWATITGKPTLFDGVYSSLTSKPILFDGTWLSLTGKPTTLAGYGITDGSVPGPQGVAGATGAVGPAGTNATTTAAANSTTAGLMPASAVTQLASTEKTFFNGVAATTPKHALATTTTASDGSFSVTYPASTVGFTASPNCVAQAYATAAGVTNTLNANITAPTVSSGTYTVSGWVSLLNQSQTITGTLITNLTITPSVKAAGAGVIVVVTADGN